MRTTRRRSLNPRHRLVGLVACLAVALLFIGLIPPVAATPVPERAPAPVHMTAGLAPPVAGLVRSPPAHSLGPLVTGSYDWDPMEFVGPANVPVELPGGEGARMAADDNLTSIVEFGGITPTGLTNLTLLGNETTGNWTNVSSTPSPSARANFSFAADPTAGFAVLFGGMTNLGSSHVTNDTWLYYFGNHSWRNVTRPVAPPRRESAAFAIDPAAGVALLEGGWDPSVTVDGSTASVIWNDTWRLNLTSFKWTELRPSSSPPPLEGSGMAWAPTTSTFLLYGGCGTYCSSQLWSYSVSSGSWAVVGVSGDPMPAPREGATVVWEGEAQSLFIFGGDAPAFGGRLEYNDTYLVTPETPTLAVNNLVVSQDVPTLRYDAPGVYLGANGCPGVFLLGGSAMLAAPPTDAWFLDANPDIGEGCNVWGDDSSDSGNNSSGHGGPCSASTNLTVLVQDRFSGASLANASVSLAGGHCGSVTLATGPAGFANFTNLSGETYTVSISRIDYHSNTTVLNVSGGGAQFRRYYLTALPHLVARTLQDELSGSGRILSGVTIYLDGAYVPAGYTNSSGLLEDANINQAGTTLVVLGVKTNYSNATVSLALPFTGPIWANLTLTAFGLMVVEVTSSLTGRAIPNATGTVSRLIPPAGPQVVDFTANEYGLFNDLLPRGNYSVTAQAPGFVPNRTGQPVFHPWINETVIQVNLTPLYGANLSVRLVDVRSHLPIPFGNVSLGNLITATSDSAGWAYFVDVLPTGEYQVVGSKVGYIPNSTSIYLGLQGHPPPLWLNLTPIPNCPATAECSGVANGAPPSGFTLLPSGGATLAILVALPFVLLGAAFVYAWESRRSRQRSDTAPPARPIR